MPCATTAVGRANSGKCVNRRMTRVELFDQEEDNADEANCTVLNTDGEQENTTLYYNQGYHNRKSFRKDD